MDDADYAMMDQRLAQIANEIEGLRDSSENIYESLTVLNRTLREIAKSIAVFTEKTIK
jgi:prefoldin subunit 5